MTILKGVLISIFPNQFKAPQGWRLWNLLPRGATSCASHYPAIFIYYTEVHVSFCNDINENVEILKVRVNGSFTFTEKKEKKCVSMASFFVHYTPSILLFYDNYDFLRTTGGEGRLSKRYFHLSAAVCSSVGQTRRALLAKPAYQQCWRVRVRVPSGTLDFLF